MALFELPRPLEGSSRRRGRAEDAVSLLEEADRASRRGVAAASRTSCTHPWPAGVAYARSTRSRRLRMSPTKWPQRPEPFVASSTARRKVRGSICRSLRVASTWEARALMGLRVSGGKKPLICISLETRRSKYRSSRGDGGGCRGRRAATVDHWGAVVNGTRAAGGSGGA